MWYKGNIYSKYFGKTEANASDLLDNLEVYLGYYMRNSVLPVVREDKVHSVVSHYNRYLYTDVFYELHKTYFFGTTCTVLSEVISNL